MMKFLTTISVMLCLISESTIDYNILIGSWKQKSIANSGNTAIFSFKKDSIARLEVYKGDSDAMMAAMDRPYKIERSKGIMKVTMMGKEKVFRIENLNSKSMTIKNISENKESQTFERYK